MTVTDAVTLRRRARLLSCATISWNTIEAVVAIAAGLAAGSGALIGFGLDSTVEVSAAVITLWYLRGKGEEREQLASRLIALTFFALGAYVAVDAISDLVRAAEPDDSIVGIVLAIASTIIMPFLAQAQHRNATRLGSRTLLAEAAETKLCVYLSVILLVGLALNATVGWWWADPLAALGIALLAANEGREAWRGEDCC